MGSGGHSGPCSQWGRGRGGIAPRVNLCSEVESYDLVTAIERSNGETINDLGSVLNNG